MAVEGMTQVTLYMKPATYRTVRMLALKEGRPVYEIVNTALSREIIRRTTPEERQFLQGATPKKVRARKKKAYGDKKKASAPGGNGSAGEGTEA